MNFIKAIIRWVLMPVRLALAGVILLVGGLFYFLIPEMLDGLPAELAHYVWNGI